LQLHSQEEDFAVNLPKYPKALGAFERWRRQLRRRILEPVVLRNRSLRETVLNALAARGHLIYCQSPQGNFFVDPGDRVVAHWMMWRDGWQRGEIEQMTDILARAGRLPRDAVFVDAGANIGTHTAYALQSGQFARAVSCEPEPNNLRLLEMNMAANGLSSRVRIVPMALGAQAGSAVLHLHPRNKGAHSLRAAPSHDGQTRVDVPMVRLDEVLRGESISPEQIGVIWIDVEGFEPQVVQGLGSFLGRSPLAIEYAPQRYAPDDGAELRRLLEQHYTTLHRLGPETRPPEPIAALASITSITDILVF
jgi:FkbM family methyltransferase